MHRERTDKANAALKIRRRAHEPGNFQWRSPRIQRNRSSSECITSLTAGEPFFLISDRLPTSRWNKSAGRTGRIQRETTPCWSQKRRGGRWKPWREDPALFQRSSFLFVLVIVPGMLPKFRAPLRWHETTNILRLTGTLCFSELASGYVGSVLSGNSRRCSIPRTVKRYQRVHGRDWSPLPPLHDRGSLGEKVPRWPSPTDNQREGHAAPMFPCGRRDSGYRVRGTMGGPSRQINGEVYPSGLGSSPLAERTTKRKKKRERNSWTLLRVTGSRYVEVHRTKCTSRQPLPRRSLCALRSPDFESRHFRSLSSPSPSHFLSGIYLCFWVDTRLRWSATSTPRRERGQVSSRWRVTKPKRGESVFFRSPLCPAARERPSPDGRVDDQMLPLAVYLACMIARRAFSLRYFVNRQGRSPALSWFRSLL